MKVQKKNIVDVARPNISVDVAKSEKTGNPTIHVKGRGDMVEAFIKKVKSIMPYYSMSSDVRGGYLLSFKNVDLDKVSKVAIQVKEAIEEEVTDKVSLVVKKKEVIDAKNYGGLVPNEASLLFEIYEDGGFGKSSLKIAEGLEKKGYITFINNAGSGPDYKGVLTKKGESWVKDYEDGKFDSLNLGMFGGVGVTVGDDKSVSISNGVDTIRLTNKKWVQKLAESLNKATEKM